jgi:hypothetical protein
MTIQDNVISNMQMVIVKASFDKQKGVMRWRSVNSDTDDDLYEERMSLELFKDFTDRINNNIEVPDPFKSVVCEADEWCGGMPYLSIAHFRSGTGKKNVPGQVESVYIDGTLLKSKGTLYDTDLGRTVFKSLCDDLYGEKSDTDSPVRISIGFLDLEHKHVGRNGGQDFTFTRTDLGQICPLCSQGIGNKIYMKGQLVHLAMTRVPVNPRTEMGVEKSMDIKTKADDARSIVGDLVEELEEKSQVDDVLVIKSNEEKVGPSVNDPAKARYESCYDPNTDSYDQKCMDAIDAKSSPEIRNEMNAVKSDVSGTVAVEEKSAHPIPTITGDPAKPETWRIEVKDGNETKSYVTVSESVIAKANVEEKMTDKVETEKVKEVPEVKEEPKVELSAYAKLEAKKEELKSKGIVGDAALKELQPFFNELGKEVTQEFSAPASERDAQIFQALSNQNEAIQALALQVAQLTANFGNGSERKATTVPTARSLQMKPGDYLLKSGPANVKPLSQIERIARTTVGLQSE